MDFTRFSLYSALAIVTYLMLLAWQEDYPPTIEGADSVVVLTPDTAADADRPVDLPSSLPATAPSTADTTTSSNVPSIATGETVRVITDTLELSISLDGGDITSLALPQFLKQLDVPSDPFDLLQTQPGRSYVAQSGLIGPDGIDSGGRASYRSRLSSYVMQETDEQLTVDLVSETDEVTVTKRYRFTRGSYLIEVSFIISNQSTDRFQANAFGQIKRDVFDDPSAVGGFGRTYLGFVTTSEDDPYIRIDFDEVDDGTEAFDTQGGWVGFSQHYFISAWIPEAGQTNRYTTRKNDVGQYFGEFTGSAIVVAPGESAEYRMGFYAGPKDQYALAEISPNLDLTIDYGFLWFLAAPIYWLLRQIDSFINNYGFSIIALTLVVKALFYKLTETQYRSMAGMRRVMPKMESLKETYGDDRMKLQQATMELYKKEKINPFGGCLPMLVQMPVFIALYWVLLESVELRHAAFGLWLQDLSVRDPYFILPLLMAATMYLQTSLSPTPADPIQARVMKIMPVMMGVLFLWFPAGLVLYWLTNGLLGILQQWYITRKLEAAHDGKKAA
ncbi:MAG: membrane protein insertase YidC [Pseudohongiellaceae bacterium]